MKSLQELYDAGYAIPQYDISRVKRTWRHKEKIFTTPYDVPVETVMVNGHLMQCLPIKTEGVAMKGIWDDMGDRWVWRYSPDGGDFHIPSEPKEAAYVPVNGTPRCIGLWIGGQFTYLFKMPNDSATS